MLVVSTDVGAPREVACLTGEGDTGEEEGEEDGCEIAGSADVQGKEKERKRTSYADTVLAEQENRRNEHRSADEQVDLVSLLVVVRPDCGAEKSDDGDGGGSAGEVVDLLDGERAAILEPESHETVGACRTAKC